MAINLTSFLKPSGTNTFFFDRGQVYQGRFKSS